MKKLIIIFLLLISGYSFAQDRTMNKAKVKDTLFVYKGIWFGVDSSYMDVAGGTASDTTYWNYPTYDGHKMINARQSKQVNADSGYASSGYIWLKAPTNKNKGSYYIGSGTPGIGATSSGNNIFGYNAGALTYSGGYNNIIGYQAGAMLYDGYQNTFIGANSGYTSSSAYKNVFIGHNSGYFNTTGAFNTFLGWQSGYSTTSGLRNLYLGYMAGNYMTTESNRIILNTIDRTTKAKDTVFSPIYIYETSDTATSKLWLNGNVNIRGNLTVHGLPLAGGTLLWSDTTTALGTWTMINNASKWEPVTAGSNFIKTKGTLGIVADSLFASDSIRLFASDSYNLFVGYQSGVNNNGGIENVFIGNVAGCRNTTGEGNLFSGYQSGYANTIGNYNTFIGNVAGFRNISGGSNVFLGGGSGNKNTTGSENTYLGGVTGQLNNGNRNIIIGYAAGYNLTASDSILIIDNQVRTSEQNDTLNSLIFGRFRYNSINQNLVFNSNVFVKHSLLVAGDTVFKKSDTTPTNGLANKIWVTGKFSTIADRIAGDKWGLVAPGSGYINVLNSKKIIASNFFSPDSSDVFKIDATNNNIFIGQGGKRDLTGTYNIVIGDATAGDALTTSINNVFIGKSAGSSITTANNNTFVGYLSGQSSTGTNNSFFGTYSGRNLTTESNRIIINSISRTNKAGDTTQSPIYIYEAATMGDQIIYTNGNLRVSNNLRVNGQFNFGTDAQISDDYVVTIPGITSYVTGQIIVFSANTLNTGACTINVNSLGAKSLKVKHDQDPEDSYIEAGSIITAIYDGTNFQIQTPDANP
jgi:7,8-dihydro-6-hydroxymethylpterin-pyrophosphokinase